MPEGPAVEVDVECRLAERGQSIAHNRPFLRRVGPFDDLALAGHNGTAGPVMPPAGGEREIVTRHVVTVSGGWHSDGADLWAERRFRNAGHGSFGIEQRGEFAAMRHRAGEHCRRAVGPTVRPTGERDARPLHPKRSCVGVAVDRIVQSGENMVEQIFDACTETVEVKHRRCGKINAARSLGFASQSIVMEPHWNACRTTIHEIKATDMRNCLWM